MSEYRYPPNQTAKALQKARRWRIPVLGIAIGFLVLAVAVPSLSMFAATVAIVATILALFGWIDKGSDVVLTLSEDSFRYQSDISAQHNGEVRYAALLKLEIERGHTGDPDRLHFFREKRSPFLTVTSEIEGFEALVFELQKYIGSDRWSGADPRCFYRPGKEES